MAFPLRSRTENAKCEQPLLDRHGALLHAQRTTLFFCLRPSDHNMKPSLQIFQSTALASWWPVARLNRRLQARRTPPRGSSPLRHRHDRQHYTWRSGGQCAFWSAQFDQKARQPTMLQGRLVPESGPVFAASMGCFELISRINARHRNNGHIFEIERTTRRPPRTDFLSLMLK
jgi:hypothetical protein